MAVRPTEEVVWVAGNLTTDLIIDGVQTLPAWGREVAGSGHTSVASGQSAYLAFGLARLDVPSRLIGIVGNDAEGSAIRIELAAAGVDTTAIDVSAEEATSITVVLVRPDGERAFASDFACQRLFDRALVEREWDGITRGRALCLVGLFNLPHLSPGDVETLFARARAAGVPTLLDTGWDPNDWPTETVNATRQLLAATDIFLPNREEATALTGLSDPEEAAAALELDGASTVVVKCGAEGSVGRSGGRSEHVPAIPISVHDTVGAGDSFNAGFLYAHLQGRNLRDCMEFAGATAANYVSRVTNRYPTLAEVQELLAQTGLTAGTK